MLVIFGDGCLPEEATLTTEVDGEVARQHLVQPAGRMFDHDPSSLSARARDIKPDNAAMVALWADVNVTRFHVTQLLYLGQPREEINDPDQEPFQAMLDTAVSAYVLLGGDKMGASCANNGCPVVGTAVHNKAVLRLHAVIYECSRSLLARLTLSAVALACNRG